jgi:hypothetical protein
MHRCNALKLLVMKYNKSIVLSLSVLVLLGCASSLITTTWIRPNHQPRSYSKIMVIGIMRESDRFLREKMENHLVGDLKDRGYNAVSALAVYGQQGFKDMDSLAAYNKLRNDSVDAVLTIVLLDKKKETQFIPARGHDQPYTASGRLWVYYNTMHSRIEDSGYFETVTKYFWESNFYDLANRELDYSVQTESFEPESANRLAHEYGLLIVNSMVKSQLVSNESRNLKPL